MSGPLPKRATSRVHASARARAKLCRARCMSPCQCHRRARPALGPYGPCGRWGQRPQSGRPRTLFAAHTIGYVRDLRTGGSNTAWLQSGGTPEKLADRIVVVVADRPFPSSIVMETVPGLSAGRVRATVSHAAAAHW